MFFMKKIFIPSVSLICFFLLNSCITSQVQQSPPPRTANFENQIDKNANYVLANEWMVESFNNAQSVIQFTDKESGTVKGKYILKEGSVSTSPYVASTPELSAIITLRVRDNKIRIEIDPPTKGFYSKKAMGNELGYTASMFDADASNLISDFQKRMKGKESVTEW
ncbi:hypothetical protein [Algoriphagus persicinus]|uniref:hypothetical protein n=1 Tax=Algoriphagus persicinus TaxID=3108754 RepID=UPI002B3A309F|nr:hypothetical protein [Algoriphagus sp. E1-3-M2]MEB2785541.1 hypothetical protein [Algoriphagus sp. E1-3-M2]